MYVVASRDTNKERQRGVSNEGSKLSCADSIVSSPTCPTSLLISLIFLMASSAAGSEAAGSDCNTVLMEFNVVPNFFIKS